MAKTFTAPFAQTPRILSATCTAANTTLTDSPDNTVALLTAGSDGSIITRIDITPRVTVTAAVGYLYLSLDAGSTWKMIDQVTIPAMTVSTTVAAPSVTFTKYSESTPLRLTGGGTPARLAVGCSVAFGNGVVFRAECMDY